MREERSGGGWAARYRVLLLLWALALVLLSNSMLGDVKSADMTEEELAGPGQIQHRAHSPLSSRKAQKPEPKVKLKFGHKKMLPNHTWVCDKGYTGPYCEDALCDQGCQHGKCLRPGYCTCEDGYKGRACDEAVCSKPCVHGKCTQPDFCQCDEGFFGGLCDQQCEHGTFAVVEQRCRCDEGWVGKECGVAVCDTEGCLNGECVAPDECVCFSGWGANNCTLDQLTKEAAKMYLDGLMVKVRKLPALVVHKNEEGYRDSWKYVRKWTAHLQQQWQFGRSRFMEGLPMNDTLIKYTTEKFETCAAVGNSGGLLRARAGQVIDEHDVVLRFNSAPTKSFEEFTGAKTTFRLLNRKAADTMLETPTPVLSAKRAAAKKANAAITLLWRAESYHYYGMLRKKYADEPIYLLAPELLIPMITLYKTLMKRMEENGVKWDGPQSAPTGFMGIAFLMQVCEQVDVYGFDVSRPKTPIRYHYYDKTEPTELHSTEFEHNLLRMFNSFGSIRLCTVDTVESCIHDWEVDRNRIGHRRLLHMHSDQSSRANAVVEKTTTAAGGR